MLHIGTESRIRYAVNENPPLLIVVSQALQHIFALFSALVVLPTIVGNSIGLPQEELEYVIFASITVTAITTFIQVYRFGKIGSGYILFTGTAAAFVASSIQAAQLDGFAMIATMSILAAPVKIFIAYFLGYLRKIVTPIVGGVVIMIVSITLIPIALEFWVGEPGTEAYQQPENLLLGAVTFIIIAAITIFGRPAWRLMAPVIGIGTGYILASFMGMVDWSTIFQAPLMGTPQFHWPGLSFKFSAEFWSILVAFIVVNAVSSVETVGDTMALQRVSERNFKKVDYERVQGALYSDTAGNVIAGLFGTLPNTCYSGNISIVEITGVASRRVGLVASGILFLLAFLPLLTTLIMSIPAAVLGASLFIFFSMLFVTGLKLATHSGLDRRSAFLIGISFWAGFTAEYDLFFSQLIPAWGEAFLNNGIAVGGGMAFLLSLLYSLFPGKKTALRLKPEMKALRQLQDFLAEASTAFSLTDKTSFQLQLLCEETFVYLVSAAGEAGDKTKELRFTLTADEQGLLVEVQDRSEVEDIDMVTLPEDPGTASQAELDRLGLALLGKIASDVTHIRISGTNYISFRLVNKD